MKIDPQDPWDIFLLKQGEKMIESFFCDNHDPKNIFDCLEIAESFFAGSQYPGKKDDFFGDLAFGAFSTGTDPITVLVEKPKKIPTPQDVLLFKKEFEHIELQWAASGQPDGPGTEGVIWIARVWDTIKDDQILESRCMADKLSWVIGYAFNFLKGAAESSLE